MPYLEMGDKTIRWGGRKDQKKIVLKDNFVFGAK
jgi:hypothetical protein